MDFAGKSILIVGAGGMGVASARRFAAAGAHVVLSDIDTARLAEARSEVSCTVIAGDIAKPSECRRIVDEATNLHGRLDILLNAAGVWVEGPSEHLTEAQYDRVLDINLKGAYFLSAAAIPHAVMDVQAAAALSAVRQRSAALLACVREPVRPTIGACEPKHRKGHRTVCAEEKGSRR